MKYQLGIKKGMTRVYSGNVSVPVSVIDQSNCVVSLVSKDGYELGTGKSKKPTKAMLGKYAQLGYVPQFRYWVSDSKAADLVKVGAVVALELADGVVASVDVQGVSKGKGFAGVMKRHGFSGGQRTHGQSDRERAPGSIGAGTDPGRVFKGKRMAGRIGSGNVTVRNKRVVAVKDGYALVSGAVPGIKGGLVVLKVKE